MNENKAWRNRFEQELRDNILAFWIRRAVDREHGGIYGVVTNDLEVIEDAPKASVICARVLWTYAAAYRILRRDEYLQMAYHALRFLLAKFWDPEHSGIYWMLDAWGNPLSDRKQTYSQAFAIYGLSELFRTTGEPEALEKARELFLKVEEKSYDPVHQGYLEAAARNWEPLEDLRLSEKDMNCPKSMNTHLHVMEAYTNLLRVWPDTFLKKRQAELIQVTLNHIVDPQTFHFRLFFDMSWNSLSPHVSFGHDIEGSWLLVEAAAVLGDPELLDEAKKVAIQMAQAVYDEGLDADGSLFYEASQGKIINSEKHWWPHAEAVVGFYNAFKLTGQIHFRQASWNAWEYIEKKFIDRQHGEWFGRLNREGIPYTDGYANEQCKVGPWKCPYHNARVCFEMMERLAE